MKNLKPTESLGTSDEKKREVWKANIAGVISSLYKLVVAGVVIVPLDSEISLSEIFAMQFLNTDKLGIYLE